MVLNQHKLTNKAHTAAELCLHAGKSNGRETLGVGWLDLIRVSSAGKAVHEQLTLRAERRLEDRLDLAAFVVRVAPIGPFEGARLAG